MTESLEQTPLWRHQKFLLLAAARIISVLGNGFARVALAFAVLALPGATGSRLSLVLACQALPQLVFILVGGVIADRMSRSRLMVLADLLGAAAYSCLAVMVLTEHAPWAAMCTMAVVAGTATALFTPAMDGVLPIVVPSGQLQQANGLLRMGINISLLLGLGLSGVAVALVGAGWALALNASSFVLSAGLTAKLRISSRPPKKTTGWADLREGWNEFTSRQWLWVVVAQYTVVVAVINAYIGVLGPLDADQHQGGARSWSVIIAAQALGTISGAGFAARLQVQKPILIAVLATFPTALPIALLAAHQPVWLIALGMFIAGFSSDVFAVLWTTTIQRQVPEESLSRVSSYEWFGSLSFAPLGLLIAGPASAAVGTVPALAVCAGLVVVATAAALLSPAVRTLRSSPGEPPTSTSAPTQPAGPPARQARPEEKP
ncbi:MFS transporter [Streptomyces sp. NPDC006285]|uniref:MFS transporter n=1 Tax=Streptomyces sp. NPDC006285 TaxID=3364742 RepID=UPI0036CAC27E